MALSDHEKAVREAVAKTERANKLRAAEFRLEQAQKAHEKASGEATRTRDIVKAAQLTLDAVKDQIKMAEKAAKDAPAAPAAANDPLKEPA